jgi:hypothetical protein
MAISLVNSILLIILGPLIAALILYFGRRQKTLAGSSLPKLVTLTSKKTLNHDTIILTFQLPRPKMLLGLTIGQHVRIQCFK